MFNKIDFSETAENSYKKLPLSIKKKADRQLKRIMIDSRHPSLRVKKIRGTRDKFEARIDRNYRFAFSMKEKNIYIHTLGPHDKGLGKK